MLVFYLLCIPKCASFYIYVGLLFALFTSFYTYNMGFYQKMLVIYQKMLDFVLMWDFIYSVNQNMLVFILVWDFIYSVYQKMLVFILIWDFTYSFNQKMLVFIFIWDFIYSVYTRCQCLYLCGIYLLCLQNSVSFYIMVFFSLLGILFILHTERFQFYTYMGFYLFCTQKGTSFIPMWDLIQLST